MNIMINKTQLKEIVEDLLSVYNEIAKEKEGISNLFSNKETIFMDIFKEGCTYHRGFLMQENKQKNISSMKNETKKEIIPMTEKQSIFITRNQKQLRKLGFDIDNIQSKKEAFNIISEFKKLGEKNDY